MVKSKNMRNSHTTRSKPKREIHRMGPIKSENVRQAAKLEANKKKTRENQRTRARATKRESKPRNTSQSHETRAKATNREPKPRNTNQSLKGTTSHKSRKGNTNHYKPLMASHVNSVRGACVDPPRC